MSTKVMQFSADNPNPVLSVTKDRTVLYSNEAGELLLKEWGLRIGDKLPSSIGDIVQRVLSKNSPERMKVKLGNKVYLVAFHPSSEDRCVNIYGFDISDLKKLDEKVRENEIQEMANLELAEVVDVQAIQSLMNDFYKLTHIPIGLNDLKGNVLTSVGWQEICIRFHRVHPETCRHCIESDTKLSTGVIPGKFKMYKCKNNMWDITTPIMVGDQQVGILFLGQFFFEDEPLDYEFFLSQGRKYGFSEKEYMTALVKVPRLNRETVNTGMAFLVKLANMISQLSFSNVRLVKSLAERDTLVEALQESEKRERARLDELTVVLDAVPAAVWITHDPQALKLTGNRLAYEWLRLPIGANMSKASPEGERPETYRLFKDGVEIPLEDMPVRMSASGKEVSNYEFDIAYPDGTVRHLLGNAKTLLDVQGNSRGAVSAFIDITERKRAEEALKEANDSLEVKVKERTAELETAYNLLEENKKSLEEAQRIAHIGNWDWDIVTGRIYWSDEIYRIFGCSPQELGATYEAFLSYIHPDDQEYMNNVVEAALIGKPYSVDYRIVLANGEVRIVHEQGEVFFDEENIPIRMVGTVQDITERKKAEMALANYEASRKKEIHHRIKNNLQVISSLLDLQADKFSDPKVIEAFRESQNRVISMALIHEELHKEKGTDTLDFSEYLETLSESLFQTFRHNSKDIHLCTDLDENMLFDMDTAVPLGIIVNELVSNSFKYAFPDRDEGEIRIRLQKVETEECKSDGLRRNNFVLSVSDNGVGIPENIDIENLDSLGLQLVTSLVDQLDGQLELKRDNGTEFTVRFPATEKNYQSLEPARQYTEPI